MKLPSMIRVKKGDFCNLLPSFMKDYDSYDLSQSEFTKEQYIDLINKQIDIRVKDKIKKGWWSYFRIEWYDDDKMYDLYLPDKHLKIIQYIFDGDRVIINPTKIEDVITTYNFTDSGTVEDEKTVHDIYRNWAKNKTVFKVLSMYSTGEPYDKFSNNWCVLQNNDIENHDLIKYVALPDWVLIKPIYAYNKKQQIKKFINY